MKKIYVIHENDEWVVPLAANGIEIAGIEMITDREGQIYTYDVNTNTNYNSEAENKAGVSGMGAIAKFLGEELAKL
jgi:hypothetical protein